MISSECHVNWPVIYPESSYKIIDPVSAALPKNLRRIFVATLVQREVDRCFVLGNGSNIFYTAGPNSLIAFILLHYQNHQGKLAVCFATCMLVEKILILENFQPDLGQRVKYKILTEKDDLSERDPFLEPSEVFIFVYQNNGSSGVQFVSVYSIL